MRLSDWSSDVCSSDLRHRSRRRGGTDEPGHDDAVADNHFAAVQAAAVRPRRRLGADDGQPRQFVHDLSRNTERTSVVLGKSVSVSVDIGGRRIIKNTTYKYNKSRL